MTDITPAARRHRWNENEPVRLAACDDGNDRTEKTCPQCGVVKITVHPPKGFPWREWRTKEGHVWTGALTPPCVAAEAPAPAPASAEVPFA